MTPRIPPLAPEDRDAASQSLVEGLPGAHLNIVATLIRHPDLFGPFAALAGALTIDGRLDARSRELLTLRTAVNCRSDYEWGQHVASARAAGDLDDDDFRRVAAGTRTPEWSAVDAALLDAADELHTDSCISDATWAALAQHLDEQELIEIVMLVGLYHLVAFAGSSFRVEQEPGEEMLPL